jgi:hypothetical protein
MRILSWKLWKSMVGLACLSYMHLKQTIPGKQFVRIRNPWGKSEWKGPWSDGSKEWTGEWLARLPELHHKFGDDGEFLMEYKDFLKTWTTVERSRLFTTGWKLSSMWLNVTSRSYPCAWSFGDVSCEFLCNL